MNNMYTLNEIKTIIKTWFNAHAQLNSVFYEDAFDFTAERHITYPTANIEWLNSNINNTGINHNFRFVIADQTKPNDSEMEDNIHSDALLIFEDFYSYMLTYEVGLYINKTATIKKFTQAGPDNASGIDVLMTISTIRPMNRCATPIKTPLVS